MPLQPQKVFTSQSRESQAEKMETRQDLRIRQEVLIKYGPNGKAMSTNERQKVVTALPALAIKAKRDLIFELLCSLYSNFGVGSLLDSTNV